MKEANRQDLVIVKSNEIIEARYKLNVREQKFILYVASLIQPEDAKFRFQKVRIADVAKVINPQDTKWGGIYKVIEEIVYSLNTKPLRIIKDNGEKLIINWIASANIKPKSGYVTFEFSDELRPYLLQLKSHFTKYKFKNILHLKSAYSIRLYEILKSNQYKGEVTYELEYLKYILGLEDKYPEYKAFKRRVIKRAEEELKARSDIYFTLSEKRENRRVKYLNFKIFENKIASSKTTVPKPVSDNEILEQRIMSLGCTRKRANEIINKGFDNIKIETIKTKARKFYKTATTYIEAKLNLVESEQKEGRVVNAAGYFLTALREDYRNEKLERQLKDEKRLREKKKQAELKKEKEVAYRKLNEQVAAQRQSIIDNLLDLDVTILDGIMEKAQDSALFRQAYQAEKTAYDNYKKFNPLIRAQIHKLIMDTYPNQFKVVGEGQKELEKLKKEIMALS